MYKAAKQTALLYYLENMLPLGKRIKPQGLSVIATLAALHIICLSTKPNWASRLEDFFILLAKLVVILILYKNLQLVMLLHLDVQILLLKLEPTK